MDNPRDIDGTQLWIGSYLYVSFFVTYSELISFTPPHAPNDSSEPQGDPYSCTQKGPLYTYFTLICPLGFVYHMDQRQLQ